jgi:hypothetical protein
MDKSILLREIAAFRRSRDREMEDVRRAALLQRFGLPGMDALMQLSPARLAQAVKTIRQSIAKERMRGIARHILYDLNRHIALKELLDELVVLPQIQNGAEAPSSKVNRRRRSSGLALAAEAHGAGKV